MTPTTPHRRRFQFSLRTMFVGALIIALPGAWWDSVQRQYHTEQRAIVKMQSLHRTFRDDEPIDTTGPQRGFVHFESDWRGPRILARWQQELPHFTRVVGVFLMGVPANSDTIAAVCEFQHLETLNLESVTGADHLAEQVTARYAGRPLKILKWPEQEVRMGK